MIGTRLRAARNSKSLTQAALADAMGISQPAYFQYESGKRVPNAQMIVKLCNTLGVSADYLLGLDVRESSLSDDEARLIRDFRDCDRKWQLIVLETARAAALSSAAATETGEGDAEGIA